MVELSEQSYRGRQFRRFVDFLDDYFRSLPALSARKSAVHRGISSRSIRLRGYDCAQAGAYFVTIVTKDRACLFGEVVNGEMRLNDRGVVIHSVWEELPDHYPGIERDVFVVMPNHIHGVVVLVNDVGAGPRACPAKETGQPQGVAPTMSLPDVDTLTA